MFNLDLKGYRKLKILGKNKLPQKKYCFSYHHKTSLILEGSTPKCFLNAWLNFFVFS